MILLSADRYESLVNRLILISIVVLRDFFLNYVSTIIYMILFGADCFCWKISFYKTFVLHVKIAVINWHPGYRVSCRVNKKGT